MANKFWTPQTEKLTTAAGIGLSGYSIVSSAIEALPALPELVTKPLIGGISVLTVAGGFALYGVIMLYLKY